jgi:hypothetical protein
MLMNFGWIGKRPLLTMVKRETIKCATKERRKERQKKCTGLGGAGFFVFSH